MTRQPDDTSPFSQILFQIEDHVATITLNRPERLNAFTSTMGHELVEALERTDADDEVRAVIVTGSGRGFCAGADLGDESRPGFTDTGPDQQERGSVPAEIGGVPRDGGGILALRLAESRKPLIAAVNGPAVGVGATMTLPMDIRIASDQARFGFVFTQRGLVPEAASSWFLPRVVGISQAAEWALTGRLLDAGEALAGRLVSRVVPTERLLEVARGVAGEIAENTSAVAVAATRRMLWASEGETSPWRSHLLETMVIRDLKRGGDPAEGAASFLQKRAAEFPMRVSDGFPASAPHWPARPGDLEELLEHHDRGPL